MKIKTKYYLFLLVFVISFSVKADLHPYYLKVSLSASKTKFTTTDLVQLNVTLTNGTDQSHSILVPGNQSNGLKLIFFSWYRVDEKNFYTEVHRDTRIISMDTSVKGQVNFNRLGPNESTVIPFFFNDRKNAQKHIQSNFEIPKLAPGNYKIIAWYNPWDEELSKYVFNKIDWKDHDINPEKNPELLDLSESGTQSTYFDVEILTEAEDNGARFTTSCEKGCTLCRAIERENWKKTKRLIRQDSRDYKEYNMGNGTNGNWQKAHRNIAFLGDNPDAILASLPSYLSRDIIFQNKNGIHYFALTWQFGKTSKIGSRINTILYIIGLRKVRIRDSKINYSRLKYLSKIRG
jgi:ferredoxin